MFERYTEKARRTIFFARYEASQLGSSFIETEHMLLGLFREDQDLARRFLGWGVTGDAPAEIAPEIAESEKRIKYIAHRMEEAIANQAFEKARFYSEEERKERENLRQLCQKHNVQEIGDSRDGGIVAAIRRQIEAHTTRREKVSTSVDLPLSHESKRVLAYGAEEAGRLNHKHIGTDHLLLGLLREEKCFAADILHQRGLRLPQVREEIAKSAPAEEGRGVRFESRRRGPGFPPWADHFARQSGFYELVMQGAGRVLHLARLEAERRNSPCIETTDLLLALTLEKEVSDRFPGLAESVRQHKKLEPGPPREKVSAFELPFSENCKFACTFAAEEAAQLGQPTGPAHLLLGIMRVESCAAAEIVRDCGMTQAEIRARLTPPPPSSDPEQGRSYV